VAEPAGTDPSMFSSAAAVGARQQMHAGNGGGTA